MFGRDLKKLKPDEIAACEQFIRDHEHLSFGDYALKCNRWMLDQPKPKRYSLMWALVMQANGKEGEV
jgi:hypothetical protein